MGETAMHHQIRWLLSIIEKHAILAFSDALETARTVDAERVDAAHEAVLKTFLDQTPDDLTTGEVVAHAAWYLRVLAVSLGKQSVGAPGAVVRDPIEVMLVIFIIAASSQNSVAPGGNVMPAPRRMQ